MQKVSSIAYQNIIVINYDNAIMKALFLISCKKLKRCLYIARVFERNKIFRCYGTHYQTLGVNNEASLAEIRDAYLTLSKELHPDVNQNDPKSNEKFLELQEAYSVLSDPSKRTDYDVIINIERMQRSRMTGGYGQRPTSYHTGKYGVNPYSYGPETEIPDVEDNPQEYRVFITMLKLTVFIFVAAILISASTESTHIKDGDRELQKQHIAEFMMKRGSHRQFNKALEKSKDGEDKKSTDNINDK